MPQTSMAARWQLIILSMGVGVVIYVRVSMFAVSVAPAQERLRTRRTHSAHKDTKKNAHLQTFLKKNYLENAFFAKRLARDKKN